MNDIVKESHRNDSTQENIVQDDEYTQENSNVSFEEENIENIEDQNIDNPAPSIPKNNSLCFTNTMHYQTKLLKILDDANTPHYLYREIIEWAIETQDAHVNFGDLIKTREGNISHIEKLLPWLKSTAPYIVTTNLKTNDKPQPIEITVFDFKTQLMSLLDDKTLFGDINNLDVNPEDPFGLYNAPHQVLSTVNSGMRYRNAYQHMITNPEEETLIPIIFGCDETKVSNQGRAKSWPLMFTTSILNQETRNKSTAWRPLGYIPDLNLHVSAAQEKKFDKHLKYTRLHQTIKTILKSFVNFQKEEHKQPVYLSYGPFTKKVIMKTPSFFIIGDIQGGDKMSCSAVYYSNKMDKICQKCNVRGKDAGDPNIECEKIEMELIQQLLENENFGQLDKLNQYHVHNAWFDVDLVDVHTVYSVLYVQ